ncbi:MAG: site-specific integrase [Alicyclobacillus macrosporangiidus]|uniref:site-specific integrase n=1 Tax=Alicyclobacillus macrosporangiidus TaxID=392015 RepID=UPI0026EE9C64|nr:N-terminal phage integrase SAM-like domain-containing protein [Alicyclobacillus macrosporangiidus]MCL6601101.1 site-specific integrase [Alicyclobacillus macrosporangiidus]
MRGSIRKDVTRKEGTTWSVVFDVGVDPATGKRQRRRKRGFKTKMEAEKYLAEQLRAIESGTYIKPSRMTFGQYLDYWLDNYARVNVRSKTYEVYCVIARRHVTPVLGGILLTKLQPIHLQKYYTAKQDEGLSAQTVRHHHRLISKALNDAVKWQLIPRNVSLAVTPPKPRKVEMVTLDVDQIGKLLDAAKGSQYHRNRLSWSGRFGRLSKRPVFRRYVFTISGILMRRCCSSKVYI